MATSLPPLLSRGSPPQPDSLQVAGYLNCNPPNAHATGWKGVVRLLPGDTIAVGADGTISVIAGAAKPAAENAVDVASLREELAAQIRTLPHEPGLAFEASGGLKSSAMLASRRHLYPGVRLATITTAGSSAQATQVSRIVELFGASPVVLPFPSSNPGGLFDPSAPYASGQASGYAWDRLSARAVAALADLIGHFAVSSGLRYEQAADAGVGLLVTGHDLGRASTFASISQRGRGGRYRPQRVAAAVRRRLRAVRTPQGAPANSAEGARRPVYLREEFAHELPPPSTALPETAVFGAEAQGARHLRSMRRTLEDEFAMAAGYGIALVAPLCAPPVAEALAAGPVGHGRRALIEATDPAHSIRWPERRFDWDDSGKTPKQAMLRASERLESLVEHSPKALWVFLDRDRVGRRAELCRAGIGNGPSAERARQELADYPDVGELSQAEVVAEWLRQWT